MSKTEGSPVIAERLGAVIVLALNCADALNACTTPLFAKG